MLEYNKILLLSDMDGTLLDSKSRVSKENQAAVKKFIEHGGRFGIATGRSQLNSVLFLDEIQVNAPCILYNGGALYDFAAKRFISMNELPKQGLVEFIKYCLKEYPKAAIQIYCPEMCYFVSEEERTGKDIVALHQPCRFCKIDRLMDRPWIKILISTEAKQLQAIHKAMADFGLEKIDTVFSSEIYLEVLPFGVNKGSALTRLREYLGEDYIIYAVGDYNNDVEMLQAADIGIATGNALASLKEVADKITVCNDEHAIADIINHMIEGKG
jgi:hypothetical protein